MPIPAILLNLIFFPCMIVGNGLLFWAFGKTTHANIWPTEKFFGFQRRRPFQLLNVIGELRKRSLNTENRVESRKYRRWLHAIYLGYGLCFIALAVLLAFVPWLTSQIPQG